ncbi:MAG: ribosomal-processing cysteine protease Prp [Mollicutes bacterium]|nr:ribosomal-processing cysteine protease Prp [Mollicutes bacterium]MDY5875731.1 ribosomal-processing cysteine protease Prp [Bacilli bacterium]
MIKVSVLKENRKYKKITILGHAMYDDYGKDIVCSACSSIVITTVNGILALKKGSLDYLVSKKGMTINVKIDDETTQILLNNMVSLLRELEGNYPNNIEVK